MKTYKNRPTLIILLLAQSLCLSTLGQHPQPLPKTIPDSAKKKATQDFAGAFSSMFGQKQKPKPYKEIITDKAITHKGLLTVHKVDDKYYLEINDSLFSREILAITRFVQTPSGRVFAGEMANQMTISFEKGPMDNVFLRIITLSNYADSSQDIYKAVANSNVNTILSSFPIAAYNKDSTGLILDMGDYIKGDNLPLSLSQNAKRALNIIAISPDRSYIEKINTYPINTEIKTVKTFNVSSSSSPFSFQASPTNDVGSITMELNTSLILLSKTPMPKRLWDKRVGYFRDNFTYFSDDQQKVETKNFVVRWRMQPKQSDSLIWAKGWIVEPERPLVYYIDPATPKKWRKYIIQGIEDWRPAFEQAGFKNAIKGLEWPENDSTMTLEDARFSVIRYYASNVENAFGPNVHDPRSGEILESHIGWHHNMMKLVHDWYMIQTAAVDPRARKMVFDDSLMGQLIRFVAAHEVGHTLGLMHNFGSSSRTPVENLRNRKYLMQHGHTPSIMDYARMNYVAQPEDNIRPEDLINRVGEYDRWAIQWGYGPIAGETEQEQKRNSNALVKKTLASNPLCWFSDNMSDPRCLTEDLGDDAIKAGNYGIKNLQRIINQLPSWTEENASQGENLSDMYTALSGQFERYLVHASANIGGIYENTKSDEEFGPVYEMVQKSKQKSAYGFIASQLFETPQWFINHDIWDRINNPSGKDPLTNIDENLLNTLISQDRLVRMQLNTTRFGPQNAYSATELLNDLQSTLFSELTSHRPIDPYRRTLQRGFVEKLSNILKPSSSGIIIFFPFQSSSVDIKNTDIPAIVRAKLSELRSKISTSVAFTSDPMSNIHLKDLVARIRLVLEAK